MSTQKEQLTITIPSDIAAAVKAKVISGEFGTEGEVLSTSFVHYISEKDEVLGTADEAFDQLLHREVLPILDQLDADPAVGLSLEQVRTKIAERRAR